MLSNEFGNIIYSSLNNGPSIVNVVMTTHFAHWVIRLKACYLNTLSSFERRLLCFYLFRLWILSYIEWVFHYYLLLLALIWIRWHTHKLGYLKITCFINILCYCLQTAILHGFSSLNFHTWFVLTNSLVFVIVNKTCWSSYYAMILKWFLTLISSG